MSEFSIIELSISNFRKFERYKIRFADDITVLFGKNGVGKTSLLHALHKACSFIFSGSSKLGERFLSSGVPGLSIQSFDNSDFFFNTATRTISDTTSVAASATFYGECLHWELFKRSTANASLYTSKYENAFARFYDISNRSGKLPVLAYFSDSFPHKDSKMTANISKQIDRDEMPRNFGYFQWDFESACTSIWETRLCDVLNQAISLELQNNSTISEEVAGRKERLLSERNFIQNVLVSFSKELPGEHFKVEAFYPENEDGNWQLGLIFSDGTKTRLQKLPAGYRRLYSIVLDLAYRAFTLNKDINSPGMVIIDEIDLHLHPELEQSVVACLKAVFPSFQFIISTHSPLVLSNIDTLGGKNIIYSMMPDAEMPKIIPDIFGIDYSATVSDVMDVEAISDEITTLMDSYLYLKRNGLEGQAENVFSLLLSKVGNRETIENLISRHSREIH